MDYALGTNSSKAVGLRAERMKVTNVFQLRDYVITQ
jgi:hypothetical protein